VEGGVDNNTNTSTTLGTQIPILFEWFIMIQIFKEFITKYSDFSYSLISTTRISCCILHMWRIKGQQSI